MSLETLNSLKAQASTLTNQEKHLLAHFLLSQSNGGSHSQLSAALQPVTDKESDKEARAVKHQQHTEWLKANREQYAGRYVALDGGRLVGEGKTFREANEQAKQNGVPKALVVRVTSENEVLFAGW